jgi:glycosyltransferase involved in cell wall biosynthesis
MRVLHVISTLAPTGAGQQLRLLTRHLPHDCEVVTLSGPGPVAEALRAAGTPVHELAAPGDYDPGTVGRLRRLIRRGGFDVVHTHLYRACVLGRVAARLAGVPHVVATEHGPDVLGSRAAYLATERLGRATIAVSPAIAGQLRAWGVPDARRSVIPRAVDTADFRYDPALRTAARARLGIPAAVPVIGAVGRLEPGHRFDRLIRATAEVPGAVLLLVGDGPARSALTRLAAIEGIAGRVKFAGPVEHTREMLCAMDVFASPSDQEPDGLLVLEALAAGLPALYVRCPPLEERAAARAAVPGTRRLTAHDPESLPRALRAEVLCVDERRGARLPVRDAGSRYDARRLAAAVDRVYQRVTVRPHRSAAYHFRTRGVA